MRKYVQLWLLGFILITFAHGRLMAQAPGSLNYQAIARDSVGNPLINTGIHIFLAFNRDSAKGALEYKEQQNVTTNQFGLFTAVIGKGTPVSHHFSDITWNDGHAQFMTVTMQVSPYTGVILNMGSTQLMSVPYSLIAGKVANGGAFWKQDSLNNISNTNTGSIGINGLIPNCRLSLVDSTNYHGINIMHKESSGNGAGVYVVAPDNSYGVVSNSKNGTGVYASGTTAFRGSSFSKNGYGVLATTYRSGGAAGYFSSDSGLALQTASGNIAINGLIANNRMTLVDSTNYNGIYILHKEGSGNGAGVYVNAPDNSYGVFARSTKGTGVYSSGNTAFRGSSFSKNGYGILATTYRSGGAAAYLSSDSGLALQTANGNIAINGVVANNRMTLVDSTNYNGIYILHKEGSGNGAGVYVNSPDNSYGVFARSKNGTGVYASGTTAFRASSFSKNGYGILATTYRSGGSAGYFSADSGYAILTSTGNVGFGTQTPLEQLDVNGGIRLGNTSNTNTGTMRWNGTNFQGYNGSSWVNFGGSGGSSQTLSVSNDTLLSISSGNSVSIGHKFWDNTASSSRNDAYFTGSGSVGIGWNAPAQKLDVNGAIKIGTTSVSLAGTIRWDGTNFQGYNGSSWVNFGGSGTSQWTSNGSDIYNNNSGGVAIGNVTSAGNVKLHIRSTAGAFKNAMLISHTNSYGYGLLVYDSSGSSSGGVEAITTSGNAFTGQSTSGYGLYATTTTGSAVYGFVGGIGTGYGGYFDGGSYGYALRTGAGNVGIGVAFPTHKLEVSGNGYFSGNVTASCGTLTCSDIRYKKNIEPLKGALDKVMQMRGVNYYFRTAEFKDKGFTDKKQIGVIAQELEKLYPELVDTDDKGYKSVDYAKIAPVLIEAIKELKAKCDALQQNNDNYKASIDTMKNDIDMLKAMMVKLTAPAQAPVTVSK